MQGVDTHFCVFSHSFMHILAHLKDMCSLRAPLSSTHSISVPTLALLPAEMYCAKSPVAVSYPYHSAKLAHHTSEDYF